MTLDNPVPQLIKMLKNLDRWLETGAEFAKKKNFDPEVLLTLRLAPDQYALGRQIQVVCDNAKYAAARLSGKAPPAHPDTEKTLEEMHARIKTVVAYLETYTDADFAGAADRRVTLAFMEGKYVTGKDYLSEFAIPNFYFHLTTAYAILRHNGVELGKRDFIGSMPFKDL